MESSNNKIKELKMDLKGQTQLSIDVDKTTAYKCDECDSEFFEEVVWSYGPQTRFMSSLDINSYKTNRFFDGNTLTMAYQFIEEDRITRKLQSNEYNNTYIDAHVTSLNWDFTLGKLVYGLEYYQYFL